MNLWNAAEATVATLGRDSHTPGVAEALGRRRDRRFNGSYATLCWGGALVFVLATFALIVSVTEQSAGAFAHSGVAFLWSGTWNPANDQYGAGLLIIGTLVTTAIAIVVAAPVGIGVAIFASELAPGWLAGPVSSAIELLAAVPSIVIGLWALLVLSPVFASHVEPFLGAIPGLHGLFGGPTYGPGILLASVVLAIMVLPTMVALSRGALRSVARSDREAVLAMGGTKWQVIRTAVLPGAGSGLAAATTLAVGRALGESIAVAMVIGNSPSIPHSLFAPGATLGSAIVNQFAESSPGLGTSSVIALGGTLLLLTVGVNVGGYSLMRRRGLRAIPPSIPAAAQSASTAPPASSLPKDRSGLLAQNQEWRDLVQSSATRSLLGRGLVSRLAQGLCLVAVAVAVIPLAALLFYTFSKGAGTLSGGFLSHAPTPAGVPGGGISTAILGTAKIMALALVFAIPIGLFTSLLLYERNGLVIDAIRFAADVLTGVPSILIGIFAYAVLVEPLHHFSNLAASFALAMLMAPIIIRTNEVALRAVPVDQWEAGIALGARRSAVARRVVLKQALPAVVSGNLLATARGIGETAPLLFTVASPTFAMTLYIFTQSTQAYQSAQRAAWATALVLMAAVLALSLAARTLSWALTSRSR